MTANCPEEKLPFLETDSQDGESKAIRSRRKSCILNIHGPFILIEVILLVVNIGLLFWNLYASHNYSDLIQQQFSKEGAFSPATSAVPPKVQTIDVYEPSLFTGQPRHELDAAWSNLLRSTQIKVTADEMHKMNKTSVALRDGSGYLGYPEALHQLHCVKRMYQYRHQDYYTSLKSQTFGMMHWDHCIEVLRRGIMCNADLTINTVEWRDGEIKGISTHPRVCKDWSALEEWADARALHFNTRDPSDTLVMEGEEGTYGPLDLL